MNDRHDENAQVQTTTGRSTNGLSLADEVRADFPLLSRSISDRPIAYLDNAATTQKPQVVLDAINSFYRNHNANVHRGVHRVSQEATGLFEEARATVARYMGASSPENVVFVRGATEAINLVAASWGGAHLSEGDEILLSAMEHHANIVPWQLLCERTGAVLRVIPMNDDGSLDLSTFGELLSERTKIVGVVHVSNALGTINPVAEIIDAAHKVGAVVLVDGAQALAHGAVDVSELGADFYTLSGHKVFGPTGIGALYGRSELLTSMPPYQGGGDMIRSVSFEKTTYADSPGRFEAGTPNIAGAIGLAAALDYVDRIGRDRIAAYETELLGYGTEALLRVPGLRIIGTASEKASILSFTLDVAHPHDIGTILDGEGVAVRTGHHCTQPVMSYFGIPATTRASLAFYNTTDEIDRLIAALGSVREMFA